MSEERVSGGNGAVVAIVVVLAILLLVGVVVVGGGALLYLGARQTQVQFTDDVMVAMAESTPAPTVATESDPLTLIDVSQPVSIKVTDDSKLLVNGVEMTFEKLEEGLQAQSAAGATLRVKLTLSTDQGGDPRLAKLVTDVLHGLKIGYEVQAE